MPNSALIQKALKEDQKDKSPQEVLEYVMNIMGDDIILANSFSAEDVVIADMMAKIKPGFKCFVLDTGRLNPETYEIIDRIQQKYSMNLEILFPDKKQVEDMVKENGINLFYDSIENRKQCCFVRKVELLNEILPQYSAWVCGLRREQSSTRSAVLKIETDENHDGMLKINPLADWSYSDVWDYIKANNVPYNKLYDQGYKSIGCAPCTRAIEKGEPERSGRWWWEDPDSKECGLHSK